MSFRRIVLFADRLLVLMIEQGETEHTPSMTLEGNSDGVLDQAAPGGRSGRDTVGNFVR
jgi:hypothetical protein